ncbi:DNA-binding protein [Candidatus Avoscillospira sp. LCP25S3_F1]|uniref:DNA-binding protein n=1 Tax=Candidatus Avoscillospira sp. LCP25S3_F1 TaxID=3438825 RepID=UPI003F912EB8
MSCLGFDTSNYTTSVACFDGKDGLNCSRLLDVKPGELGLRQSDALFAHVKRLPELFAHLKEQRDLGQITAVGVSTRPRPVEGSYMPCFLAGESQATVLSAALDVPLYRFSHQEGHIAASLWSSNRLELLKQPHLAWHLSGGTTELLLVEPWGKSARGTKIGGTTDISAGQLIDRTGKLLGLQFPAGKSIDALSQETDAKECFRVKCKDLTFSLSGVENKVMQYAEGHSPAETAAYALRSVIGAVLTATNHARTAYPGLPVVFSGGVASNSLLRQQATGFDAVFCPPQYATDNAMGIAVLTWLQEGA